jgi:hypothetical protein
MIWEETMTLQELSEHYQLRAQLEKDEDILYNLRMAAIPSAHPLDGMPRAPGVSDKVGALAIAIVDMEERISERADRPAGRKNLGVDIDH